MSALTDAQYNDYVTQLDGYTTRCDSATGSLNTLKKNADALSGQLDTLELEPNSEEKLQQLSTIKSLTWWPIITGYTEESSDIQKLVQDWQALRTSFQNTYVPTGTVPDTPANAKLASLWKQFLQVSDTVNTLNHYSEQVGLKVQDLSDRLTSIENTIRDALGG